MKTNTSIKSEKSSLLILGFSVPYHHRHGGLGGGSCSGGGGGGGGGSCSGKGMNNGWFRSRRLFWRGRNKWRVGFWN